MFHLHCLRVTCVQLCIPPQAGKKMYSFFIGMLRAAMHLSGTFEVDKMHDYPAGCTLSKQISSSSASVADRPFLSCTDEHRHVTFHSAGSAAERSVQTLLVVLVRAPVWLFSGPALDPWRVCHAGSWPCMQLCTCAQSVC